MFNKKKLPVFTEKFLRTDTCRDTGILVLKKYENTGRFFVE